MWDFLHFWPTFDLLLGFPQDLLSDLPSDAKLLLTKNYSEIIIFEKLRISRVIPWKCLSFLDISRGQNASKITKNNSQGIYFCNNFVSEGSFDLLCVLGLVGQLGAQHRGFLNLVCPRFKSQTEIHPAQSWKCLRSLPSDRSPSTG